MPLDMPSPTIDRNDRSNVRVRIVDGDVHPALRSNEDLRPFLPQRWWDHWQTYGLRRRNGSAGPEPYPKSAPLACRRDAWPEEGGRPGSSLAMMQRQLLDEYQIELGVLGPLGPTGQAELNAEFSAAMCRATNDWQLEAFTRHEKRLKAGLVVPFEDAALSVAEIDRCGADLDFGQVFMLTRTTEPLGNRRYWPIYEAAQRYDLPVGLHVFGAGGHAYTGAGWHSYYIEEGAGHSTSCQTVVTSLVMEGVLERFPDLRVVMIEGGFGWLAPLAWRLDKLFERFRSEVPHLKMKPSEYIKRNIWATTQPMEEPDDRRHLFDTMEWIGWDRLLFASDYPHWDFDDPTRIFPAGISRENQLQVLGLNAQAVYKRG
jgi:predicted TIM-barrel fold metal-dependent hydrolase